MSDEMVRKTMEDSEGNSIGPLAGAFPELASLTDADLEWARQQWQRGMERQLDLVSSESLPDWDRLDAMQDEDIDLSDSPEIAPEMFAKGVVRREGHSLPQSPRFQTMLARSRESIARQGRLKRMSRPQVVTRHSTPLTTWTTRRPSPNIWPLRWKTQTQRCCGRLCRMCCVPA
jgi:hypothetical protein